MNCPHCGVEVNEQVARCHSCGAIIAILDKKKPSKPDEIKRRAKGTMPFVLLALYLLLMVALAFPLFSIIRAKQRADRFENSMNGLMDKLDAYADANGFFPDEIYDLINEGFITAYPQNPYQERLMKPRDAGSAFAGDFTYIPVYDDTGRAKGCVLVGYGPNPDRGKDIFTKGNDYSRLSEFHPEPDGKPDGVVIILHSERGEYSA